MAVAALLDGQESADAATQAGWSDPFALRDAFQLSGPRSVGVRVEVDGEARDIQVAWRDGRAVPLDGPETGESAGIVSWAGDAVYALEGGRAVKVALVDQLARVAEEAEGAAAIKAPMHGKVIAVDVAAGDTVAKGDRLAVVEAMKMEHAVVAPRDGTVETVFVSEGGQVDQGAPMVSLVED
jgi:3-methylcrotonyl-CoA carboxylase alpha subunit